jgi:hypothetical protein
MSTSRTTKKRKPDAIVDDIEDPIETKHANLDGLLIDKYIPLSSLELAVHKKKIDQVRDWFSKIGKDPRVFFQ